MNVKKFPVGFAYGDRDYVGSEGADWIVKTNAFFATGESQLFRVANRGHALSYDDPESMAKLLTDFF